MSRRKLVNEELAELAAENDGLVTRQHVLAAAKKRDSALYAEFDAHGLWNDKKAAERARLEFAGRLIRTYIINAVDENLPPVRAMVSVMADRERGGGYRQVRDVLNDAGLRENLLATALMELRALQRKYEGLVELAGVWAAIPPTPAVPQAEAEERVSA